MDPIDQLGQPSEVGEVDLLVERRRGSACDDVGPLTGLISELTKDGVLAVGRLVGEQRLLGFSAFGEKAEPFADDGADAVVVLLQATGYQALEVSPAEVLGLDCPQQRIGFITRTVALVGPCLQHGETAHELGGEGSGGPEVEVVDILG